MGRAWRQPLPKVDAVVLRCRAVGATVFASLTAAVSLMTYLCAGLAAHLGETSIERLRRIEDIHIEWGDGVEADWQPISMVVRSGYLSGQKSLLLKLSDSKTKFV